MTRLAQALAGLSGRERWLLAALGLLGLPAALWLALAEPLLERRAEARAALAEAAALHAWVLDRQAEFATLPQLAASAPEAAEGAGGIEARLQLAGLTEAGLGGQVRLTDAGEAAIELSFERVGFALLMAWIDEVEAAAGYRLTGLDLRPAGPPGEVEAALRIEARR